MKVPTKEAGTKAIGRLKSELPVAKSAYLPSGRLQLTGALGLLGGAIVAIPVAVILAFALLLVAAYLLVAIPEVAAEMNAMGPLKIPLFLLAFPIFAGIGAGSIFGPWILSGMATGAGVAAGGKRGRNRNERAAVVCAIASGVVTIGALRYGPFWPYAIAWAPAGPIGAAGHWLGVLVAGATLVTFAATASREAVRSARYCEPCNLYLKQSAARPVGFANLIPVAKDVTASNWSACVGLLALPQDDVSGELQLFECPQCGEGFGDLHVRAKAEWEGGDTRAAWVAASSRFSAGEVTTR